jgi:hypothetical protein
MTGGPELPQGAYSEADPAENTVELQLTAAEQLELQRASIEATAQQAAPLPPIRAAYDPVVYARSRRIDVIGTVAFAVMAIGVAAAAGWHVLGQAPAPTLSVASPAPALPRAEPQSPPPVVQILNPFDAREVFELPADISEAEARSAIADLLLERARERRRQGMNVNHASGHPALRSAAVSPADVFVTRVPGPVNRFAETTGTHAATGMAE